MVEHDSFAYPPRCMSRIEAARYLGVSPTLFDSLIEKGTIPRAKKISEGRVIWDRVALDMAVNELPDNQKRGEDDFEAYLQSRRRKSK